MRTICIACVLGYVGSASGEAVMAFFTKGSADTLVSVAHDVGEPSSLGEISLGVEEPTPKRPERDADLIDVTVTSAPDCRAGFACEVNFHVVARDGWHANKEAPWKFVEDGRPSDRLTYTKSFNDGAANMHFVVWPYHSAPTHIKGSLRAFICKDDKCKGPIKRDVDVVVPIGS